MWADTKSRYPRPSTSHRRRPWPRSKTPRGKWRQPRTAASSRRFQSTLDPGLLSGTVECVMCASLPWCRSRPLYRGAAPLDDRVEDVSYPIADEVGSQNDQTDRQTGKQHRPVGDLQELPGFAQVHAPARGGWLDAEPEEAQARLQHDDPREIEAPHHAERGGHPGQHVGEQAAPIIAADGPGPLDELPLTERQHLAADDTGEGRPAAEREDHDQDGQAAPGD